jgi:hypothetical protein
MLALQENIAKFEQHNGRIVLRDKELNGPVFPDGIEPRGQA